MGRSKKSCGKRSAPGSRDRLGKRPNPPNPISPREVDPAASFAPSSQEGPGGGQLPFAPFGRPFYIGAAGITVTLMLILGWTLARYRLIDMRHAEARTLRDAGRIGQSAELYRDLVRGNPQSATLQLELAGVLLIQSQQQAPVNLELLDQSLLAYLNTILLDPSNIPARHGMAHVFLLQYGATHDLVEDLESLPGDANRREVLQQLRRDEAELLEKARIVLKNAHDLQPANSLTRYLLARTHYLLGNDATASYLFTSLVYSPRHAEEARDYLERIERRFLGDS